MSRARLLFLPLALCLLTGYSWEHPSPGGETAKPGESPSAEAPAPEPSSEVPVSYEEAQEEPAAPAEEPPAEREVTEPSAEPETSEPPAERDLGAAKVSLFVNDAKNQAVYRGWPLFVKVTLENPGPDPVVLEAGSGWKDFVDVEVKDERGRLHDWPFRLAPVTRLEPSISLGAGEALTLVLIVEGGQMRAKTGAYTLDAVAGGSLRTDRGVVVRVQDHPESLSDEEEAYRDKLTALYDLLTGKKPKAPQPYRLENQSPQVVYVQQEAPQQNGGGGAEALQGILGLVSEFGMQGASFDTDYSEYSDYVPEQSGYVEMATEEN